MRYVTYDETGRLTGCYLQDLPPEHVSVHIEVSEGLALNWPAFRANAPRDGIEPAPTVTGEPGVPKSVTRRQARQALLLAGLLDQVPLKIAAIADDTARGLAQIEWADSQVFERDRPLLISLATQLGLTTGQLDDLFVQAAEL